MDEHRAPGRWRELIRAGIGAQRLRDAYREVVLGAQADRSFLVMVVLSAIIAAFGLLADSTAVVIGAMLLAPLMGPILGVALALVAGDGDLLRRALVAELAGVALALAVSLVVGLIPLKVGLSSEILARTQPTLYDLAIALAAGLAGAYAILDERVSPSLPGVAIAVALLPPLASCGICLASGRADLGYSAFLLFFANFVSIQVAAACVFALYGMPHAEHHERLTLRRFLGRIGLSLAALTVVAVLMTRTLLGIIAERRFEEQVGEILRAQLRATVGASLDSFRHQREGQEVRLVATALTPQAVTPEQVARLEDLLRERVDDRIHLIVRSILSSDADRRGPVFALEQDAAERARAMTQSALLATAESVITRQLEAVSGARLVELRRIDNGLSFAAVVQAPEVLTPAQVAALQTGLAEALDMPARLVVHVVPVRVVDAKGYVYDTAGKPRALSEVEAARRSRLTSAMRNQLGHREPAAALQDLRIEESGSRLAITATVAAPRLLTPADVAAIEQALRRYVAPRIDLTVRTVVEARVTPTEVLPLEASPER